MTQTATPIYEAARVAATPLGVVKKYNPLPEAMDTCRGCHEWTPVHDLDADGLCWGCGS